MDTACISSYSDENVGLLVQLLILTDISQQTFCKDIRVAQRMNLTDFCDPLTCPVASLFGVLREMSCQLLDRLQ